MVLAKDEYDPNYASDAIIIVMEKEKPIDMPADRETTDRDKSSEVDTRDWKNTGRMWKGSETKKK